MRVCVVRNPSAKVKGKLRSMGVEVATNVFALDVTTEDMTELWEWMETQMREGSRATLIEPATGKPGFFSKGLGDSSVRTVDFDGIPLRARPARKAGNTSL